MHYSAKYLVSIVNIQIPSSISQQQSPGNKGILPSPDPVFQLSVHWAHQYINVGAFEDSHTGCLPKNHYVSLSGKQSPRAVTLWDPFNTWGPDQRSSRDGHSLHRYKSSNHNHIYILGRAERLQGGQEVAQPHSTPPPVHPPPQL